jgi:hypothetical protein
MTHDLDDKIGQLLREDAPPERDPLFRISVRERRERVSYRRKNRILLAGAVLIVLLAVASTLVIDAVDARDLLSAGLIALLILGVVTAGLFSVRGVLQIVRQLRG